MAREATARLYDVDQDSVLLKNLTRSGKYDTGTITFRAKKGKQIDLDKLHESIWATRLSGGTSSGLVSLEVTVIGEVAEMEQQTILKVASSAAHPAADTQFLLAKNPAPEHSQGFDSLRAALDRGERVVSVSGKLDGWSGVWPKMLRELPAKPRRILVTEFETAKESETRKEK